MLKNQQFRPQNRPRRGCGGNDDVFAMISSRAGAVECAGGQRRHSPTLPTGSALSPHPFRASAPVFNPFPFSWDHWAWRLYCPRGMFVAPECRHFLLIDRRAWENKWQTGSCLEGFGSSSHPFFWWFTNKKAIESKAVCLGHQISNNVPKLL